MSFTYIISSRDDSSNPNSASNCNLFLGNLPTGVKQFRCRVINFSINTASLTTGYMTPGDSHYLQLVSDNFIDNGGRSGNKIFNIITTYSPDCTMRSGQVFNIRNFNGRVINFRLLDELDVQIDGVINSNSINTVWHLVLELTPLDDIC